jgi:uncharacterized protein
VLTSLENTLAARRSVRPYAIEGKYELFKTSATFDGTARNAAWLGDEVAGVQSLAPVLG